MFTMASNCHPCITTTMQTHGEVVDYGTAYQTPDIPFINSWRSRLVWSRARDWKSRNRQKRFKSSNLFFSATESNPTQPVGLLFYLHATVLARVCGGKKKANMRSMVGLHLLAETCGAKRCSLPATTYVFFFARCE